MRLVEVCSCGASIEIVWEQPKSLYSPAQHFSESERSKAEITAFRRAHKRCREREERAEERLTATKNPKEEER